MAPMMEDVENCNVCNLQVLEKDQALQCDGWCKKWHHSKCIDIESKKYKKIQELSDIVKWFCHSCAINIDKLILSKPDMDDFMNVKDTVNKLMTIVKGVVSDNVLLNQRMDFLSGTADLTGSDNVRLDSNPNLCLAGDELRLSANAVNSKKMCENKEPSIASVWDKLPPVEDKRLNESDFPDLTIDSEQEWETQNRRKRNKTNFVRNSNKDSETSKPKTKYEGSNGIRGKDDQTRPIILRNRAQLRTRPKSNFLLGKGTGNNVKNLKSVEKYVSLFVSRLDPEVTEDDITEYLKNSKNVNYTVEKLNAKHPTYSSFKVGIPASLEQEIFNESFWPTGALVGYFVTRRPLNSKDNYQGTGS